MGITPRRNKIELRQDNQTDDAGERARMGELLNKRERQHHHRGGRRSSERRSGVSEVEDTKRKRKRARLGKNLGGDTTI